MTPRRSSLPSPRRSASAPLRRRASQAVGGAVAGGQVLVYDGLGVVSPVRGRPDHGDLAKR
eukprot:7676901-Pyramimonas_sp.AAC.1